MVLITYNLLLTTFMYLAFVLLLSIVVSLNCTCITLFNDFCPLSFRDEHACLFEKNIEKMSTL